MKTLIHHAHVICDGFREIEEGAVYIEDGVIRRILDEDQITDYLDKADEVVDAEGAYCTPGLIDIHIHGAAGADLIDGSAESVAVVSRNLAQDGCTGFMASLTVISHQRMLQVLKGLSEAEEMPGAQLLGIHSEGPYLSKQYKALMNETWLRDPDITELHEMIRASKGKLKIMTVAPELKGMEEFIQEAVENRITVMVGHTAATIKDVHKAALCGASGFTHLYNAMSQHLHRDPGTVTGAFNETGMLAELIADGFHVDPDVVRITWKHFKAHRLVLITDAMLGKGMPDGDYEFSGLKCRKKGNHVRVIETGRRAGSAISINEAVRSMREMCGCTPCELVQMACVNPAVLAQVSDHKGKLTPGMDADLALFDQDFNCLRTMVNGKFIYSSLIK